MTKHPSLFMIPSLLILNKKFQLTLLLVFLGLSQILAQTVAFNTARHETLSQRAIVVNFTPAGGATGLQFDGGAGNIAHWTVEIDPDGAGPSPFTTVTTSAVGIAGLNVIVQFNATALNGTLFILPGQTMRISYTGGTGVGNVQVVPFVGNYAPSFSNQSSLNNYSPTCASDVEYNGEGIAPLASQDQCSPVNIDFYRWTYSYSLRYRNSSLWVTFTNLLQVGQIFF